MLSVLENMDLPEENGEANSGTREIIPGMGSAKTAKANLQGRRTYHAMTDGMACVGAVVDRAAK